MREPNILLDALIDEAGMSHDGFAARVNQAGKRHGLVLLYDHALHLAPPAQGPAAIAPVYEWENPPDDLDVSRRAGPRVSREQVRALRAARARYEGMYRVVGGIPVRARVAELLAVQVAALVKGTYDGATGRELFRAAGGLAALAGICAYDADLQGTAQRYYFQALRMAKASGDRGFGGYVIALLTNQALYLGRNRQVIQYAETALRGAHGSLSAALVTDLNSLQAKAYARIGDRGGCHAAMTRAEAAVTRIRPDQEPPETSYVQAGLVETQHADALRTLGNLTAARAYAQQSVDAAAHSHARGRVHRLATLATVLAGQGDAEHAASTAMRMLDHATGMESRRIHERIIAVRDAIGGMFDGRASAELAERIADVTGAHLRGP